MKQERFPEGVMTVQEWVERYAVRVEEYLVSWYDLIDRRKHFRLGHEELAAYEESLKEKAKKPRYRAWRDDRTFYDVTKKIHDSWRQSR